MRKFIYWLSKVEMNDFYRVWFLLMAIFCYATGEKSVSWMFIIALNLCYYMDNIAKRK